MDELPKRKHQATGKKPPGGARPGAGRPKQPAALEYGESQAIKSLRWKVPEGTPEIIADAADEMFWRIVLVARGTPTPDASNVLRAAFRVRDEVCGQPTQKAELSGANGEALTIQINKYTDKDEE